MSKMSNVFLMLDQDFSDLDIINALDISEEYLEYCIDCWQEEMEMGVENV
jgi:hypothetical protein